MQHLARRKAAELVERFAHNLERVAEAGDPGSIHDLRVSVRRLRACLRVFRDFFPRRARKRIVARLAPLMKAAGGARDHDIALELLAQAGVAAESSTMRRLAAERTALVEALRGRAAKLRDRDAANRWRALLELE